MSIKQYIKQKNSLTYVLNTEGYEDDLSQHPAMLYYTLNPDGSRYYPFELVTEKSSDVGVQYIKFQQEET